MDSKRLQAGFTLLEVVAAIAILTFGLLAVASMQGMATRGNCTASLHTEGTEWAKDKLEELMAQPYATLQGLIGNPDQAARGIYTIQWNVANGPIANTLAITVTVTWSDKGGTKSTVLACVKNAL
jgi:prepilin-type N-terminal cleavage/methylation domain-containing protein